LRFELAVASLDEIRSHGHSSRSKVRRVGIGSCSGRLSIVRGLQTMRRGL
jgi:hypothetical protein